MTIFFCFFNLLAVFSHGYLLSDLCRVFYNALRLFTGIRSVSLSALSNQHHDWVFFLLLHGYVGLFLHYIEFNLLEFPMCGLSSCDCCGKSAMWQSWFWSPSIWQLQTDLKYMFNLNFSSEKCNPIGRVMAIVAVLVELGTVWLAWSAGFRQNV